MNEELKTCLGKIASYNIGDIGWTEENIKNIVIVPMLQCLGHDVSQLNFEHRRIDIVIKGLPSYSQVVVETKRYKSNLDRYLGQLERQARKLNALVALISNGDEMRIYFNGARDIPLLKTKREDLTNIETIEILEKLLSRENLIAGRTTLYVVQELERTMEDSLRKDKQKLDLIRLTMREMLKEGAISEETLKALRQMDLIPLLEKTSEIGRWSLLTSIRRYLERAWKSK